MPALVNAWSDSIRKHDKKKCKKCDAIRMGLFDVDPSKLKAPNVTTDHFFQALGKNSVGLRICQ